MDFEERFNRQAERHEALTQSLELLTADVRDLQAAVRETQATVRQQAENIDKLAAAGAAQRMDSAAQREVLGEVLGAMKELIGVVSGHERRINNLERSA